MKSVSSFLLLIFAATALKVEDIGKDVSLGNLDLEDSATKAPGLDDTSIMDGLTDKLGNLDLEDSATKAPGLDDTSIMDGLTDKLGNVDLQDIVSSVFTDEDLASVTEFGVEAAGEVAREFVDDDTVDGAIDLAIAAGEFVSEEESGEDGIIGNVVGVLDEQALGAQSLGGIDDLTDKLGNVDLEDSATKAPGLDDTSIVDGLTDKLEDSATKASGLDDISILEGLTDKLGTDDLTVLLDGLDLSEVTNLLGAMSEVATGNSSTDGSLAFLVDIFTSLSSSDSASSSAIANVIGSLLGEALVASVLAGLPR